MSASMGWREFAFPGGFVGFFPPTPHSLPAQSPAINAAPAQPPLRVGQAGATQSPSGLLVLECPLLPGASPAAWQWRGLPGGTGVWTAGPDSVASLGPEAETRGGWGPGSGA